MKASIIVPSCGRGSIIARTLNALAKVAGTNGAELILVDQSGYNDELLAGIDASCSFKHLRLRKANLPNARNSGANAAAGDILLFIDDDAVPRAGWLENHMACYRDPGIGCVGGGVRDSNAKGEASVPVTYDPKSGKYYTDFGCSVPQETISVPGVNFSVRKSAWEKVRFDKSFKGNAYFEEADFAFRLRQKGWKIYYEPNSVVEHELVREGGCRFQGRREAYYRFRNHSLFYFRFSGAKHCRRFLSEQKSTVEFLSRNATGGHNAGMVAVALWGGLVGAVIGAGKKAR